MHKPLWRPFALALALLAPALTGCDEKVAGSIDRVPPSAIITSPLNQDQVSGVAFFVDVTATDDTGVDHVDVAVDGGTPVSLTTTPYRVHVLTLGAAAGASVVIDVQAFDAAGNSDTQSVTVEVAPRNVVKLTTDTQSDLYPAWSPAGDRIAFQSNRGSGEMNVWVMDADGGNPEQLTTNVNEDRHPAWSPDGVWIAWDSDRAGTFDIWRMPIATGEADAENLTFGNDDDVEPAWSPDGLELFFASSRGTETDFDIWRQVVGTGVATPVTNFNEDDRAPAISPDGTEIAFTSALNFTTAHVYTMTLGDATVVPLTAELGETESDPAWAPAGRSVIFTRSAGLDGNLWFKAVNPDVAPAQATFGAGTIGDGGAAWNPDGDRIAFHSDRDGNPDIWLLE